MSQEPPPPPLPPSRFTSCDRHPDEPVTGFCASCLRERLAGLDPATRPQTSSSSASSFAIKAIFKGISDTKTRPLASSSSSSSFLAELRRSKSFSGRKAEGFSGIFEPQRKSCDVRVRNTLWSLFHLDDEVKREKEVWGEIEVETRNLGLEEGEEEEIRVSETVVAEELEEIEEEEEEVEEEVKTMKDHIDLDSQNKKTPAVEKSASTRDLKEIAGNFLFSVFSKRLQKWRRKQKMKKQNGGNSVASGSVKEVGRPEASSRRFRETQSEVADYGYGRRSCDTDPRFSLDAVRISFDDPRYSFDEPRASWDGYLIGGRAPALPRLNPMLSVVEDVPVLVRRSDNQIPVEEVPPRNSVNEDPMTPGGTVQTRDYYSDSSSKRRRSFERSNSVRKGAVGVDLGEMKSVSNSKVSPASMEFFHRTKVLVPDRDLRDPNSISNSNSLRDDCSESFGSVYRDGNVNARKGSKKSSRWSKAWSILGLIHWGGGSKDDDEKRFGRNNVVERSLSESWPELRREENGDTKGAFNSKVLRSNSSVSARNSFSNGTFGSIRSSKETNGHTKKRREEVMLERNRSARYSPSNLDNGLLRFYLTPLRGSRRGWAHGKGRSKSSHSFARSVLRLY
ncbi:protein OCTOPUS-like [Tasmannia lanceolata]|uniref:protein OCTOPUS-like n=1 Tax=Tasmannia lanceolata TaxID=3420 RepID=UPI004062BFAD